MARKLRHSSLESRSARLRLAARFKPYSGPTLARGIKLLYRRNQSNGSWVLKASDGHGAYWTKAFAVADDYEDSDGKNVLTFYEAQDAAKRLARGGGDAGASNEAPISVAGALANYEDDLKARRASIYNARMPRKHLTSVLLAKPVALLTASELKKWRDSLIGGGLVDASINRMLKCLRAALNLAARHDPRIQNRDAWTTGLETLPDADTARNVILADKQVTAFVRAAYGHDAALGLYVDTLAVTGARPSQAARLVVADLIADPKTPRLMMPKSGKGGSKNRVARKTQRFPVPITPELAVRLKAAAKARPADAALLLQTSGAAWGEQPSVNYRDGIGEIITRLKLDATLYSLRHSSIVRALLVNTPIRIIAASHDTSIVYIEKNYSAHILQHSDELSRRALLHHDDEVAKI